MNRRVFFKLIAILFILNDKFSYDFIERKNKFFNKIIELFFNGLI